MPYGYHGKILHVYLSQGELREESPDEAFYRRYYGGSALGMYYLLKHSPPGADPLGPENTLALTLSVITGSPISGQSRLTAVAKSPLSGAVGDSQSGGFFPAELKFAGYDAVILHGRAPEPVYLTIFDGKAELHPAAHLWGKTTGEVEDLLKAEWDEPRLHILQTGPAGERLVRYAALISMANRANGRTGMGAVMGAKNLKAIAVRGKLRPRLASPKELNKLARWGAAGLEDSDVYTLGLLGTAEIVEGQHKDGGLPTRNWRSGAFEGWRPIDGKTMANTILKERHTCYACTVRCKRVVEVTDGPNPVEPRYGGPEYETLATFGSYCGVSDLEAIAYANQLCGMYGLDTISTGATIAWFMDACEQGLLGPGDTGGIDVRFGDAAGMLRLVEMIAQREGIGDLLAEGSERAAQALGKGTQDLVVAVKGVEMPAHMPQVKRSLGLVYAVNPFGADHQSSEHDPSYGSYPERMAEIGLTDPQPDDVLNQAKVQYALQTQYLYSVLDSVNVCQFVFGPAWQLYASSQLVEAVRLITGWEVGVEELLRVGARRLNLMRAFNAREGLGREADRLPKKMFAPLDGGASHGVALTQQEMQDALDSYYQMAGWDVGTGQPTRSTLEALELGWVADMLDESKEGA